VVPGSPPPPITIPEEVLAAGADVDPEPRPVPAFGKVAVPAYDFQSRGTRIAQRLIRAMPPFLGALQVCVFFFLWNEQSVVVLMDLGWGARQSVQAECTAIQRLSLVESGFPAAVSLQVGDRFGSDRCCADRQEPRFRRGLICSPNCLRRC
jgi:hypothetical protein